MNNIERSCDVLVVCALKDEFDELVQVTNNRVSSWKEVQTENFWMISEATFQAPSKPPLVIHAMWMHEMGAQAMAPVVGTLLNTKRPLCLAMSGICAGPRDDVSLGDVVMANRVWQYDAGKIKSDDGESYFYPDNISHGVKGQWALRMQSLKLGTAAWLESRPSLSHDAQADWLLMQMLAGKGPEIKSEAEVSLNCPDWTEVLKLLWNRKDLKRGAFELTDQGRAKAETITLTSMSKTVESYPFRKHVGAMASGSAVMQDSEVFARLKKQNRKVLALEMEASMVASLAENHSIPWLIAKGISDYGDKFKDDRYRGFAARASAEYLLSLIAQSSDLVLQGNLPMALKSGDAASSASDKDGTTNADISRALESAAPTLSPYPQITLVSDGRGTELVPNPKVQGNITQTGLVCLVGDAVTIAVSAADPEGGELQYLFRTLHMSVDTGWQDSNVWTYTFAEADIREMSDISVRIRSKRAHHALGEMDDYVTLRYRVRARV